MFKIEKKQLESEQMSAEVQELLLAANEQHELGKTYYNGRGVAKDCKKAIYLRNEAVDIARQEKLKINESPYDEMSTIDVKEYWLTAVEGTVESQYDVGQAYISGEGVEQDYDKAIYWLEKATEQTSTSYRLGCNLRNNKNTFSTSERIKLYLDGFVEENFPEYISDAVEEKNAIALFYLSFAYKKGLKVQQNNKEYLHWLRITAANLVIENPIFFIREEHARYELRIK